MIVCNLYSCKFFFFFYIYRNLFNLYTFRLTVGTSYPSVLRNADN